MAAKKVFVLDLKAHNPNNIQHREMGSACADETLAWQHNIEEQFYRANGNEDAYRIREMEMGENVLMR